MTSNFKYSVHIRKTAAGSFRVFFVLWLGILLAACSGQRGAYRYSRDIGPDLYSGDLELATRNLETYFGYLCQQADLSTYHGDSGFPECATSSMSETQWQVLVHTGFNDIDRRCDAYLAWLEDVRHRGDFANSMLVSTGVLTNTILLATGAHALAIGIVAEAFGYTINTYADYRRMINLGFEGSTIKTIVTQRRINLREATTGLSIRYKPEAVNLLRTYLNICMPFTITMDANTYARSLVLGQEIPEFANPEIQRRLLISRALSSSVPATPDAPLKTEPGLAAKEFMGDAATEIEEKILVTSGKRIQRNLCVTETGTFDDATRSAIRLAVQTNPNLAANPPATDDSGQIKTQLQFEKFLRRPECTNHPFQYRNVFEAMVASSPELLADVVAKIERCANEINESTNIPKPPEISNKTSFSGDVRLHIQYIKENHPRRDLFANEPANDQLYRVSYRSLNACR